jgi:drug/metabolite transporter (DMT)-like permease
MSWLLFAFSGPVLWAISMHLDKYLVERFFKNANPAVLLVFTSILAVVMLPIICWLEPQVLAIAPWSALVIAASGLIFMIAMFLYFQALQSEEASVVAPFFQISPLFGYVLGYLVLGETLTGLQTLGGALIVGGTLLLSRRRSAGAKKFNTRLVVLMVACAFLLSLTGLIFKFFAIRDEFWTTMFWTFVGHAVFGAGILAIGDYRRQLGTLLRANPGALIAINAANELVNLGGSLGSRYALVLAPLGLVQAVTSTTTLFVFIFGVALSLFLPAYGREGLSGRDLAQKGAAALLIVVGVILVGQ